MTRAAFRPMGIALFGLAVAVFTPACGGFSTEDAEARCDEEQKAREVGGCFDALAYDACVAAYEECGSDVNIDDGCPLGFTCPE